VLWYPDDFRFNQSFFFISDEIIAIGGYDNNSNQFLNSCERFSLKTEQWSAFPKLKFARRSPGVVTYRGQVKELVIGGCLLQIKRGQGSG
jgi:hypothetical protein